MLLGVFFPSVCVTYNEKLQVIEEPDLEPRKFYFTRARST